MALGDQELESLTTSKNKIDTATQLAVEDRVSGYRYKMGLVPIESPLCV